MKKVSLFVVLLFVVAIVACANTQSSSIEEAKYTVEHQSDFQEIIQYFSVEAVGLPPIPANPPRIYKSDPEFVKQYTNFIHEIIYKTKSGSFKLVLLNDDKPPKIVATKEIK